jgi:hypothetical protein
MKGRKPIYKLTAVTKKRMLTGIRMNISEPVWLTDGTLVLLSEHAWEKAKF